jgi:tetratricopeptide (TPR) repeat protein
MRGTVLVFFALSLWAQAPAPQSPPPYFDQPNFIVAGVADPTQRGGHGSDPALRSNETLAKAVAALGVRAADDASPLDTVRQLQLAAERDPSELNLFNLGAELLTHRAADQAAEVFSQAHALFPRSTRALLGLAAALYAQGAYDQAGQRFFEAADLDQRDPVPYLFLGKISNGAIPDSDGIAQRLRRFADLRPENPWANYYYAVQLWDRWSGAGDNGTPLHVETLLEKAVKLDARFGAAYLELGIVFAEQNNLPRAIAAYESAIAAEPLLEEAHYRLALAYRKSGQIEKTQREIERYQELSKQSADALERERARTQQFVFDQKH